MKTVSDSTPLIHLSKIGAIDLLKELFEKIIIPKQIYEEVIVNGEQQNKSEILPIIKLIKEDFIVVQETKSEISIESLDKGESECIVLCKELNVMNLLIDESKGFEICNIFNILPLRTTSILLILLDKRIIDFKRYKVLLDNLLRSGYFLSALVYERLINVGKVMSGEKENERVEK